MKLRAHHILCIQGYMGNGYDKNFTNNMDQIVKHLKSNPKSKVTIIDSIDCICSKCPNTINNTHCQTQDKVKTLDLNVINLLNIQKNKTYTYDDILDILSTNLSIDKFNRICSNCQWFEYGYCKDALSKLLKIT
ncbi:DUF1284 domain-containing protein [Tepidibacter hydrothermalis]|uniref:DUF1284 domain-containing protein n=1 Tax=Tepidibacter hydrothermalis TaxID=3036126 RepID=A0ABY8E8Y4_9FIRM|nr:DUF1284 domain-containing protein [Tepidibacter hydrothermalis]WFD09337.1 DUF1284 domain-containing protein [Tepidibacter hydrothermalis]